MKVSEYDDEALAADDRSFRRLLARLKGGE